MLTREELCAVCDVSVARRQAWAQDGDLRQQHGFEELDAVELAACARLRHAAGPKRGKAAWKDLRDQLAKLLLDPPAKVWVVIEAEGVARHAIATRPRDLCRLIDDGRHIHVIELRSVADAARVGYRDAVIRKARSHSASARRPRRRG